MLSWLVGADYLYHRRGPSISQRRPPSLAERVAFLDARFHLGMSARNAVGAVGHSKLACFGRHAAGQGKLAVIIFTVRSAAVAARRVRRLGEDGSSQVGSLLGRPFHDWRGYAFDASNVHSGAGGPIGSPRKVSELKPAIWAARLASPFPPQFVLSVNQWNPEGATGIFRKGNYGKLRASDFSGWVLSPGESRQVLAADARTASETGMAEIIQHQQQQQLGLHFGLAPASPTGTGTAADLSPYRHYVPRD